jgi:hypothetical protein
MTDLDGRIDAAMKGELQLQNDTKTNNESTPLTPAPCLAGCAWKLLKEP